MRWSCWAIILWQFLSLNVVIPGHTRGMITMPGSNATPAGRTAAADSCCSLPAEDSHDGDTDRPTSQQRRSCAVCHVAANHTPPPVFCIDLQPGDASIQRVCPVATQVASRHIPLPYFPSGPPARISAL